jgi:hypothetical protein
VVALGLLSSEDDMGLRNTSAIHAMGRKPGLYYRLAYLIDTSVECPFGVFHPTNDQNMGMFRALKP